MIFSPRNTPFEGDQCTCPYTAADTVWGYLGLMLSSPPPDEEPGFCLVLSARCWLCRSRRLKCVDLDAIFLSTASLGMAGLMGQIAERAGRWVGRQCFQAGLWRDVRDLPGRLSSVLREVVELQLVRCTPEKLDQCRYQIGVLHLARLMDLPVGPLLQQAWPDGIEVEAATVLCRLVGGALVVPLVRDAQVMRTVQWHAMHRQVG